MYRRIRRIYIYIYKKRYIDTDIYRYIDIYINNLFAQCVKSAQYEGTVCYICIYVYMYNIYNIYMIFISIYIYIYGNHEKSPLSILIHLRIISLLCLKQCFGDCLFEVFFYMYNFLLFAIHYIAR